MRLYTVIEKEIPRTKEQEVASTKVKFMNCEEELTLRAVLELTDFEDDEIESILGLSVGEFVQIGESFILRTDVIS